jgi:hypothetical protein
MTHPEFCQRGIGERGMSEPQANNLRMKTVERHRCKTVPLACSRAEMFSRSVFKVVGEDALECWGEIEDAHLVITMSSCIS